MGKVQGGNEAYEYEIPLFFADFLDRSFYSTMLNVIGYTGILTYWFAIPL